MRLGIPAGATHHRYARTLLWSSGRTFAAEFFGSPFPQRLLDLDQEWSDRQLTLLSPAQ